ncbi:LacI family DNA-binding transcriptional regulator [Phenylobacterium sp.]|jgi:LacI family transcriptional regulator|uniref:LacI family DNA-binding transcriptional regulator n=1 Tax=Phenylobacterium sp. TaxID=1871053 RepID=UPI002F3F375C
MTARSTVQDIARRAGVHSSTVSRALNPATRHRLSAEVAARVMAIAAELGYVPNGLAASLRTRRSHTIGVILPDIADPVFAPILQGLEEALAADCYVAMVANAGPDPDHQRLVVERMLARQVDGLVLATVTLRDSIIDLCIKARAPVVTVSRSDEDRRVSSVVSDEARGMRLAVDHLVGLGHRRVGHIAGPQNVSTGKGRQEGFLAAMARHDLGVEPAAVAVAAAYTREAGREAAQFLLDRASHITAIVAANDLLALGIYDVLRARGLSCPGDVSVVGHNDMPLVDIVSPPLTTVRIRHREMGVQAARLLLSLVREEAQGGVDVVLRPDLVIRESTGAPRRI